MDRFTRQSELQKPSEIGPVRWSITAFGGCVFAAVVLLACFNLADWAIHRFDRLIDPKANVEQPPLFQRF